MKSIATFLLTLLLIMATSNAKAQTPIYQNPEAPIEERVEDLLERMTVDEKIGQMSQLNITMINTTGNQSDVVLDEEKAREYIQNHHIGSFLNGEAVAPETWFTYMDKLTRLAVEESRLGIPIIYGIDHMHGASYLGESTIFPQNINIGATFNPVHAYETGWVTAYEAADLGHHWIFAPVLDLGVNPLWPRIWETYGEDPFMASVMGQSFVSGLQENEEIAPYKLAATGKHFLAYSDPKTGWDRSPVQLSMQAIHEFHRPPFQAAVDAGIKSMMVNSGEVNGVPVHASRELLTDLLRNEMGFEGVILTDWADIEKLINFHFVAEDYKEATYMAVNAGIDMSMNPIDLNFNSALEELVSEGRIGEERLDESVRRILRLKFELGLFENPYPRNDRLNRIGAEDNRRKALEAARESIVLLRNENNVLPLKESQLILLAGLSANSRRNLNGGWTLAWQGGEEEQYPDEMHTIYTALQAEYPDSEIQLIDMQTDREVDISLLNEADMIIYAGGEEPYTEFFGNITDLTLPREQLDDIEYLSQADTELLLILVQGRPRIITSIADKTDGILFAGLPGFEGGEAIANIISGKVNPSGKLPISYPMYTGNFTPYNHKPSDVYFFNPDEANEIIQGSPTTSLFPFGYGLSYTEFEYSDLTLSSTSLSTEDSIQAEITVKNTGDTAGMESVLWHITDHVGMITRPVLELKHFEKISLEPGETMTLVFEIDPENHLSYPDSNGDKILEPGKFTLYVGEESIEFNLKE